MACNLQVFKGLDRRMGVDIRFDAVFGHRVGAASSGAFSACAAVCAYGSHGWSAGEPHDVCDHAASHEVAGRLAIQAVGPQPIWPTTR